MKKTTAPAAVKAALLYLPIALAQIPDCSEVLRPSYPSPVVGSGWTARLIVTGLKDPRGLLFDSSGNLLVVEQESGIRRLSFADGGGTCLQVAQNTQVVQNNHLTHGIAFSNDGETLFASTPQEVLAWSYDAGTASVSGAQRVVINGMNDRGHATRTLLMSQKAPGTLLVSQGSGENSDQLARDASSGISQIRAFDVGRLPGAPYPYASSGALLGWGLRNSVGVAEEPTTGGIYSVENSVDDIERDGVDIHQDNPGEELNFHGFLNGSAGEGGQGGNYGYPECYAVWDPSASGLGAMRVGDQFTPSTSDVTTDSVCHDHFVAPRLTWPAHTAPLDIEFTPDGSEAFVSFHGSWNRAKPAGYALASVAFADGEPVDPRTSNTSLHSILSNSDLTRCPDSCFRPAGLALDSTGRLFMSSDSTGEIYVLSRAEMSITGGGGGGGGPQSPSGADDTADTDDDNTNESGAGRRVVEPRAAYFFGSEGSSKATWGFGLTLLACFATGGLGMWVAAPAVGRA